MTSRLPAVTRLLVAALVASAFTSGFIQPDDEDLMFDDEEGTKSRWESEAPVEAPWQEAVLPRSRRQAFISDDELFGDGSGSGFEPHTYRIKIHILRPWRSQYDDRTSGAFRTFARSMRTSLEGVIRNIAGEKTLHVTKLHKANSGQVIAWIDLMVTDYEEHGAEVERAMESMLSSGTLGDLRVDQQYYDFAEPRVPTGSRCLASEWRCPTGQCVPHCDGTIQCYDESDEFGCVSGGVDSGVASDRLAGGCAADSTYTCRGGKVICDVQMCDSVLDCPEGDDEEGCGCQSGQFLCDSIRCQDDSLRCDGIPDCADGKDEFNCSGEHASLERIGTCQKEFAETKKGFDWNKGENYGIGKVIE